MRHRPANTSRPTRETFRLATFISLAPLLLDAGGADVILRGALITAIHIAVNYASFAIAMVIDRLKEKAPKNFPAIFRRTRLLKMVTPDVEPEVHPDQGITLANTLISINVLSACT